ncbi:ATP-binding protein [Streptomyces sp. NPDC006510]|uniref:ATP-binding protein n=1 Tax=Streptomyces sp. NPDC006510 TaxID=3155600 RepID=UPI0033B7A97E
MPARSSGSRVRHAVAAFAARGIAVAESYDGPAGRAENVPFVSRYAELGRLDAVLSRKEAGGPAVVDITGEASMGKSRLLAEFTTLARRRGVLPRTGWTAAPPSWSSCAKCSNAPGRSFRSPTGHDRDAAPCADRSFFPYRPQSLPGPDLGPWGRVHGDSPTTSHLVYRWSMTAAFSHRGRPREKCFRREDLAPA